MSRKPPPRAKSKLSHVQALNTVQARLLNDYAQLQDWKQVGAKNGVSGGTAYRVAMKGYEPRDNAIRASLGFPKLERAPVCLACGVVHLSKRCPNKRKPARARTNWKRLALVFAGLAVNGRGRQ